MTDNELDKAYHNLGMAAETGPAIFDFDEEKAKRQEKLMEQQEELRKNNLIAREARLAEIEEEDRQHKERMRWEQKEREKRILARYQLEQKRKAQWRHTIEKSAGAKELAARQVHFRWRRQFDFDPSKVHTVESGRKGRVMVVLDKNGNDPTHNGTGDELTPETLEALYEFVSMFEGVETVTELSNAVVATFRTPQEAQDCIQVAQDNADIQVSRAATAAVTKGLNVRKVNPVKAAEKYGRMVKRNEKAKRTAYEQQIFYQLCEDNRALLDDLGLSSDSKLLSSTFYSFLDAMDDTNPDTMSLSSYEGIFKEAIQTAPYDTINNNNKSGSSSSSSSSSAPPPSPTPPSSSLYHRSIQAGSSSSSSSKKRASRHNTSGSKPPTSGGVDFSGYQMMVPAGIKDELVYDGLWNNAKYWSKFGEMLDLGLPLEDSHQMAKEYIKELNNPRRHRNPPEELEQQPQRQEEEVSSSLTAAEVGECPVCGKGGIPMPDLQRHVNQCLEGSS
ncbi:hypothetical protein FOZ62_020949 [Perkinsus olseni]|uniref:Uncharacterized protein n=3 Tax=Perkinsus olseni TaxID=32597 RepID=A0A7J6S5V1_PEROL|nr:hypothetical protein FOZ62_020949 [Perkinsus olseni]